MHLRARADQLGNATVVDLVERIYDATTDDGGWAAFDADNERELCRRLPFCDFGEGLNPVTRHAIGSMGEEIAGTRPGGNNQPLYNDDGPCLAEAANLLLEQPAQVRHDPHVVAWCREQAEQLVSSGVAAALLSLSYATNSGASASNVVTSRSMPR